MKNITRYFMDTVKASDNIPLQSNTAKKNETESKKHFKEKYNCSVVEISNTNSEKNIYDMIESSSDINSFKEISIQTSKQPFSTKLSSSTKCKKLQNQHLDCLSLKTNDVLNINNKRQTRSSSLNISNDKKQCVKKSRSRENSSSNIQLNDTKNKKGTNNMNLLNIHSSDGSKSNHGESNAFEILMNRNNSIQYITPTKLFNENESLVKKSEEQLISSTEKLINEKKKCFKRKISEVEGEKIEKIIQNPTKFLKKDDFEDTGVLYQKQPSGNLLDYFSKTPVNLTHTDMADISTIIVKADVHMSQNTIDHDLYTSVSNNAIRPNKKSKSKDLQFSQMDDIDVIESESSNISNNEKERNDQLQNKHRWSLRIKFQTYEDENTLSGNSNDEEFSPKGKAKLNIEDSKKCGTNKGTYSENLWMKNKSNKMSESMKLKLRKCEQPKNVEYNVPIQNNKCRKGKFENANEIMKLDKQKSILAQNKNFNIDLIGNIENKSNEDFYIIDEIINEKKAIGKLAPIFTKQRKLHSKVIPTKQSVLQTNIKDNNDKTINQQIHVCSTLPFPLISHITQLTNSMFNKTNNFNFPPKICHKLYIPDLDRKHYKHIVDFSETKLKLSKNIKKPNVEEVLMDLEKHCSGVKKMWNVISLTVKGQSNKTMSAKTKTRTRKQWEKTGTGNENKIENVSWTYKFRPKSTEEIVGNENAVIKLREWLVRWKIKFINESDDSENDFYSSDSSYSRSNGNNQVAVLLGPHGSGKTASVYALAEEFGYTVLELNASSKRSGKKLLKELEEATKSYQIKNKERTSAFCNLTSNEIFPKKISKNSLILIEDVDIIFEEDEGFISAIYQLASNTKCPIVMTCKDVCPHLNKLAPQQSRIYFQSVVGNKVSVLLELISLAETGYRLPSNYIMELLQSGDLRKAILQLQYLLLSGPPQMLEHAINFKNSLWQNMQYYLYRPAIIVSKKEKKKKAVSSKVINNNRNLLNDVADKLDSITLLTSLMTTEDTALNLYELKVQPSLSVVENTALYSTCNNVCLEIAEWIGNKIMYKDHDYDGIRYQNNIILRKQLNKEINLALSHTASLLLDHQIIATDYLPFIRTICRAEEYRANRNNKRGNRYFHYLHNLKSSSLLKPNILSAACKIMHDIDMRTN
ncbi:ATPase family AAA domain-containing protein 5 isoform X1 [Osmia bicornis bicornis]|uniref:ATPase family AAA domain-containing protein 5 isoform X1 n=2 Tax=Osmia bicornis bicornis TaxID=1437191 RepID=UPI001EAEE09E|nr:ATPase family AAA domain-containing protein 5 isoform X1 [Osmia bicornis bicornis]XP_029054541.2 ATPase family AAA domain-containing protein 5 isoform X1 [Osmia bicornis bicornis]